eukprot:TRINITY_DN51_c0_g1_i2.p1 TRINITY_DN51_c0_g1~~TRINITY_DN51_c0_g1_i2.p1  ORF type:complete len:347 (-),score=93.50 TRINITY_DN51_c0_g1_i2:382-1422(-)
MRTLALLGLIPAAALCARVPAAPIISIITGNNEQLVTPARAAAHNARGAGWTAAGFNRFTGWPRAAISKLMGTVIDTKSIERLPKGQFLGADPLPAGFDWRNRTFAAAGGSCVGPVLDQGPCGSCWAHGAAEALGTRICIATQGATNVPLSPTDLMECDSGEGGCNGGMLAPAWEYMKGTGIASLKCTPSPWKPCDPTPCLPPFQPTPACNTTCHDGTPRVLSRAASVYSVGGFFDKADAIAREVMKHGPVEAAFTVYEDFVAYKSGVYRHTTGNALGGHAVAIVGFGTTEQGEKYWIVKNSWNTNWGMDGFFLIARGHNECGIEGSVVAGLPDTDSATATATAAF